jgi:hypothetical protein
MEDLSEQELDKFFQKSLEKRQTPFNPKAWEKMEAKLEADKKKRLLYKRLLPLLLLLLITLGSGGIYFFTKDKNQIQANNNKQIGTKGAQKIINKEQQPTISKQEEIKETNNGVAETPLSNDRRDINNQLFLNQQGKNKSNEPSDSKNNDESDGKFDLQKAQKATLKTAFEHKNNGQISSEQKLLFAVDSIDIKDKNLLVSKLDSFKRIEINHLKPTIIVVPKTNLPFGRLNIGMSVSPDWSSVKFQNINQTGYKLGLDIDYQFAKRISISTGIIFSRLFYNTHNDEYTAPKDFWTYQIKPEKVWGVCDALEVPINLRYALFNGNRQRIFMSAGISSYLLLSENYSFEYAPNMPSTLVKGWSGRNKNLYYFGIANFSLGYSGRLSSRSFWQVEPFVKLPLGSIGWGKVDLSSTGLFFSWKYILIK